MRWQQLAQWTGRAGARALFGALGGFAAWMLVEPFTTDVQSVRELFEATDRSLGAAVWAFVGAFIGIAIVGLEELMWGNRQKAMRQVLLAGALGVIGGALAFSIGGWVFVQFGPLVLRHDEGSLKQMLWLIVARSVTWMLVGGVLGLILGAVRGSRRGAVNAMLGGLLGGFLGGLLFDTLAPLIGTALTMGIAESGWASRLIGLTLMGALIGLFSTLAEQLLAPTTLAPLGDGTDQRTLARRHPYSFPRDGRRCRLPIASR